MPATSHTTWAGPIAPGERWRETAARERDFKTIRDAAIDSLILPADLLCAKYHSENRKVQADPMSCPPEGYILLGEDPQTPKTIN